MARTPMQGRMDQEWDHIRALLGDAHFDRAEAMRKEILVILILIKTAVQKEGGGDHRHPQPYREGTVSEAVGLEYAGLEDAVRSYAADFNRLLT